MQEVGFMFVFVGMALMFLGIILLISNRYKTKVEAGGVVFIGPFPIFLGATSKTALYITIALAIALILITASLWWIK